MTYQDYIAWAKEYKSQADIICKKLNEKKGRIRYASAQERSEEEKKEQLLYAMKLDCLKTMAELEAIAKHIKESERREKV
ncbi:MAG: hypothetical protein VZR27_00245 [Acutalibacteraceae bacterium]|nr:hypothetical protein [Clostridia bacterium]MEE3449121.1 hypothetical protein [Acutalibacteraceae bacterium]